MYQQPGIILLREGTDTSQGKAQLISNINACQAVADTVRTTLGPRGMDKLVFDGQRVTISNDGATIMRLLEIVHPAAKTLVDISMSQDAEVGDGTTSVVLLAGEILKCVKPFVEEGLHPQIIMQGLRAASIVAVNHLKVYSTPTPQSTLSLSACFKDIALPFFSFICKTFYFFYNLSPQKIKIKRKLLFKLIWKVLAQC
jgi:T-complex protein 1 subunit eta